METSKEFVSDFGILRCMTHVSELTRDGKNRCDEGSATNGGVMRDGVELLVEVHAGVGYSSGMGRV